MKTYTGMILNEPHPDTERYVIVHNSVGELVHRLKERQDLYNHSPTGFSWGYNGSGPAQLALAILADCYDDEAAMRWHQDFKEAFIARLDMDSSFTLTESAIAAWMRRVLLKREPA